MPNHPETMRAIAIGTDKSPQSLHIETRPVPEIGDNEVLVRIGAAGVNRGDCVQRIGLYPPPPGASDIMGLEFAGEIVACGAQVTAWQPVRAWRRLWPVAAIATMPASTKTIFCLCRRR